MEGILVRGHDTRPMSGGETMTETHWRATCVVASVVGKKSETTVLWARSQKTGPYLKGMLGQEMLLKEERK